MARSCDPLPANKSRDLGRRPRGADNKPIETGSQEEAERGELISCQYHLALSLSLPLLLFLANVRYLRCVVSP